MLKWFRKKAPAAGLGLSTDIHSHLLPGLDDGVQSPEQARDIIVQLRDLGYKKLITSPHVMSDTYRNTTDGILRALDDLNAYLKESSIDIKVEAAAEYYLDEYLMRMVEDKERLLTFGSNYLLFETNFLTAPFHLKEFIFLATTRGYKLVLAHPERYLYLQSDPAKIQDLLDRGILFQINISSITGYYSKAAQRVAYKLIELGAVHFLGSDCHHEQHVQLIRNARENRHFQKALTLPLLNNTL